MATTGKSVEHVTGSPPTRQGGRQRAPESHRQRVLACFDPYWPVLKSTVACFQIANLVLQ
jgi:hypothetical protein